MFKLFRDHASKHSKCWLASARVAFYGAAVFFSMAASARWFGDTYAAAVCIFTLFATAFELALIMPEVAHFSGEELRLRRVLYVACMAGIILAGTVLVRETVAVQQACGCQQK